MSVPTLLAPLFVQVALTFGLLLATALTRVGALRSGEVKLSQIALRQPAWPRRATQIANAFQNQVETPILFYVVVLIAWQTGKADALFVVLCWLYVASRLAHAFVHVGSNDVRTRFNLFAVGVFILLVMWSATALRVLLA